MKKPGKSDRKKSAKKGGSMSRAKQLSEHRKNRKVGGYDPMAPYKKDRRRWKKRHAQRPNEPTPQERRQMIQDFVDEHGATPWAESAEKAIAKRKRARKKGSKL